jgi:cytoskeletal protein RodZ
MTISELGDLLRTKRKEMNLSLKEVENATSIRSSYLQAIEEGEVSKLISHIYAQGFVKQYAIFLGLDGEKLVRDNPAAFAPYSEQEFSYGIGTLEMRGGSSPAAAGIAGGLKGNSANIMVIIALGGILAGAWVLAHYLELL